MGFFTEEAASSSLTEDSPIPPLSLLGARIVLACLVAIGARDDSFFFFGNTQQGIYRMYGPRYAVIVLLVRLNQIYCYTWEFVSWSLLCVVCSIM